MTLKEAIKKYQGYNVRIGAASAFIYINKCSRSTYKSIERLSEKEYERLATFRDDNIAHRDNFVEIWDKRAEARLKKVITDNKYSIGKVLDKLEKMYKKIDHDIKADRKQTEHNIERYTDRYDNYIPFLEREVKDVYPSDLNDDIIILFKGEENGDFWDEQEYKEGVKHE